jgi:hypothetical protein
MREGIVKDVLRLRLDQMSTETTRIRYLQDELQRTGDLEAARSFEKANNVRVREMAHLQRQSVRIPQELFRKMRQQEGIKLSGF